MVHFSLLFASGELQGYRLFGLTLWIIVLPLTYTLRGFVRGWLIKAGQYGVPIAIIGNGSAARRAIAEMKGRPDLGYVPVALFSTQKTAVGERRDMLGVPLVGRAEDAVTFEFGYKVRHAMLAIGVGWQDDSNQRLARTLAARFPYLQTFSNLIGQGLWLARTRPIGPYLSIETQHVRFSFKQRLLKRSLDIAISLPALILSAPILLIAGIAVVIADPGPIFFSQTREGRQGKPIKIYKLRSMIQGAEAKLAQYLAENPAARFEYERTMKLRNDPRIIPVIGRLVRKASIDELPQLWSILKGDMSLVGPRVMPTKEVDLYSSEGRELRRDMLPGLTGFWQVEHRNDSDFRIREVADSFYVANWSVWLDMWIILRTVRVVLTGAGAF
jgi:Undecaprenyl-phosphate galactose phosphotransferase WbaP